MAMFSILLLHTHFITRMFFFPPLNNLFCLMIILIISARSNGDLMYEPLFIKIIRAARGLFITLTASTSYRALPFRDMKNKFTSTSVRAKYRHFEDGNMTEHGRKD